MAYATHKESFGMNVEQLRSLVDVAELGSFTAAADRRGLTQPAVSLQLRQLEKSLGVALVERLGRKSELTAAGLDLVGYARSVLGTIETAREAMSAHRQDATGRVRIGTGATACIYLLPPILKDLRDRFPRLEVTVRTGNTSEIVKAIEENALDLGLVTLPASHRSLDVTSVLDDEFLLISPDGMPLPTSCSPADLANLPLILFEPGGRTRTLVDEWLAEAGASLAPIMSLGSVEAIKGLVGAGLGCAILPGMAIRKDRALPGVSVHRLKPALKRTLGLVMRKDKRLHRGLGEAVRLIARLSN